MSGVVRINMSESSYAIDSAWSLLQNDDKIEKVIPLIPLAVGAGFGLLGGYTGAGGRFINPNTGKYDPGFHADAALHDPFTGGILMDREIGSSRGSRLAGGAFGALQGLNPLAAIGMASRGARGAVGLSRAQRAQRAADKAKTAQAASTRAAADARGAAQSRMAARAQRGELLDLQGAGGVAINQNQLNRLNQSVASRAPEAKFELAEQAAKRSRKAGKKASRLDEIKNQPTAYQQYGTAARVPQVIGQGIQQGVPELALAAVAPFVQGALPSAGGVDTSGYGASSAGATGATNTPVIGNRNKYQEQDIWQGKEWSKQHGGNMAVATGEEMYIADRLLKGEKMFTNRLGNELLNEVEYRLHKAHSDTAQKAECSACNDKNCVGKAHCMAKADDKKKPAHGMVIVIGSKAGPGPSTDGKKDKLDSDKGKKKE